MQKIDEKKIVSFIKSQLENFKSDLSPVEYGHIIEIRDGILTISGMHFAQMNELIRLNEELYALILNLEEDIVHAVVLGEWENLYAGQTVERTGRTLTIPVGNALLGRVVNALGVPIDALGEIKADAHMPYERPAPDVLDRSSVNQPFFTGIKAIDIMVPIGKGQRELIIGDRQTGKTSIAVDAIIYQKNTGVKCIYVAIGQKNSSVSAVIRLLAEHDALKHTIVVVASAFDAAIMQFIAPYAACTMGEYFRDRGEDVCVVYDHLSAHAVAWREISLLLKRTPGREAYPGDIFYIHSRLLERAACVNAEYVAKISKQKKIGSLTALPIIETQFGDISSFVPTNVISITDGQIVLSVDLFNSGFRPAVNPGLSVSRVGGAAQLPTIKKLSGIIRISLAQYRELEAFSQITTDLDEQSEKILSKGRIIVELLKQPRSASVSPVYLMILLFLINGPYLDQMPVDKVMAFEKGFLSHLKQKHGKLFHSLSEKLVFDEKSSQKLIEAFHSFKDEQIH